MSEEDAEIALLHQMQAGAWDNGGDDPGRGIISSNTENSDQEVKEENFSDVQALSAFSPSNTGASPDDDGYDPLSPPPLPAPILTPAAQDSRSSSRASARQPKIIGGFLAEDSDEEDPATPTDNSQTTSTTSQAMLHPPTGEGAARSISRSPLHISSTPQQQNPGNVQDTSVLAPLAANEASLDRVDHRTAQNISVPKLTPQTSSAPTSAALNLPKARLPHDTVGILEDRIKEDPRGDLDAWLSLISEHRKRNKLDDARAVYERFFKVFPSAVSHIILSNRLHYAMVSLRLQTSETLTQLL
jgi:cleavage stimulation factor subunit 3